ncbi:hypothetical protein R1sor_000927 [Riccia sorocarpa]|uniref:Uncharacterized protein n=1 Tax=Riccia sorocarpa TaxID=122646 RepID=A0ABD3GUI1_9MARC
MRREVDLREDLAAETSIGGGKRVSDRRQSLLRRSLEMGDWLKRARNGVMTNLTGSPRTEIPPRMDAGSSRDIRNAYRTPLKNDPSNLDPGDTHEKGDPIANSVQDSQSSPRPSPTDAAHAQRKRSC